MGVRGAGGAGGNRFFIENPNWGGGGFQEREGPRGRESICSELGNFWGRLIFFFISGPKCPPRKEPTVIRDSLKASPSTVGRVIWKTDGP